MAILSNAQARKALRAAVDTRRRAGVAADAPICVFDFAEGLGIEVKFVGIGSVGGMWVRRPKTILVPSQRPAGRKAFTCAHELGHWYFNHGTKVDPLDCQEIWTTNDADELLVNTYAGFLLMPIWAVKRCLAKRQCLLDNSTPLQAYTVACQLGVSYEAFIKHCCYSLNLVSRRHCNDLLSSTPKDISGHLAPQLNGRRLLVADKEWETVPIDLQVGDLAHLPRDVKVSGKHIKVIATDGNSTIVEAVSPGLDRAWCTTEGWSAHVRVSRKDFEGRCAYRHIEDPDLDD